MKLIMASICTRCGKKNSETVDSISKEDLEDYTELHNDGETAIYIYTHRSCQNCD